MSRRLLHLLGCVLVLWVVFFAGSVEASYYHSDHLGSSSLMTDGDGTLVRQQYGYRCFGSERFSLSFFPSFTSRFTSQPYDAETGLYFFQSRYYDPELGRFIQPDSIVPDPGSSQSLNRYSYVLNNPLKYTDPTGHYHEGMPWHDPSFGTANFSHQGFGMERLPMARGWLGAGIGSDWLGHGFGGGNEGFDWTEHWRKLGFPDMNDVLAGSPSERSGYDSLSLFDKWKYQPARAFENTLKEAASASLMALPVVGPMARAAAAGRVGVTFAVTRMAPSVAKRGGMLGSQRTRQHVAAVAAEMESRGWAITHGGGRFPEEYLPGPGGGRLGSSFVDITAVKNGRTLRVNTVDTYANGITPTKREAANALRIRSQTPGDHLLLVPKPKPKP